MDVHFRDEWKDMFDMLYRTAATQYANGDIDALVQDTMLAYLVSLEKGKTVEHPKAFLLAVLKNQYNRSLRRKYRDSIVSYDLPEELAEDASEEESALSEEYLAVRRELGRLTSIYREVAVRYYVDGQKTKEIANELGISEGTVSSRLFAAREQMREGLTDMEKYERISYEPKKIMIGIWGSQGVMGEPFTLVHSDIESNALILAYEKPLAIRELADAMGIPCAYMEPIVEGLVKGELMGKTSGGLVYTRCYVERYEDSLGDIPAEERLAKEYATRISEALGRGFAPIFKTESAACMTEKQKATLFLCLMNRVLWQVCKDALGEYGNGEVALPERPNGGKWLATCTVLAHNGKSDKRYEKSGPFSMTLQGKNGGFATVFDFQSYFGNAHWGYGEFPYKLPLKEIVTLYASLLPCGIAVNNPRVYECVPDLERMHILTHRPSGELSLDVPALLQREMKSVAEPAMASAKAALTELMKPSLCALIKARKNRVPSYVDGAESYHHKGVLDAVPLAVMLSAATENLLPYPATIGETPLIYLVYEREGG